MRVSIPNGMEFYFSMRKFIKSLAGFNSQRDGILLMLGKTSLFTHIRFNSQRDGILPRSYVGRHRRTSEFQFPTGWNSTREFSACQGRAVVSIPNGMEFYVFPSRNFHTPRGCFNSQRDGILPKGFQYVKTNSVVSIPNGMEFYRATKIRNID